MISNYLNENVSNNTMLNQFASALISQTMSTFTIAPLDAVKIKLMSGTKLTPKEIKSTLKANLFKINGNQLFLAKEITYTSL